MLLSWLSRLAARLATTLQGWSDGLASRSSKERDVPAEALPVPDDAAFLPPAAWLEAVARKSPEVAAMFSRREPVASGSRPRVNHPTGHTGTRRVAFQQAVPGRRPLRVPPTPLLPADPERPLDALPTAAPLPSRTLQRPAPASSRETHAATPAPKPGVPGRPVPLENPRPAAPASMNDRRQAVRLRPVDPAGTQLDMPPCPMPLPSSAVPRGEVVPKVKRGAAHETRPAANPAVSAVHEHRPVPAAVRLGAASDERLASHVPAPGAAQPLPARLAARAGGSPALAFASPVLPAPSVDTAHPAPSRWVELPPTPTHGFYEEAAAARISDAERARRLEADQRG